MNNSSDSDNEDSRINQPSSSFGMGTNEGITNADNITGEIKEDNKIQSQSQSNVNNVNVSINTPNGTKRPEVEEFQTCQPESIEMFIKKGDKEASIKSPYTPENLQKLLDFLRQSFDMSIEAEDIEKSSIKLILKGSRQGLKDIVDSFESGSLAPKIKEQFNLEIQDAKLIEIDVPQILLALTIAGNVSQADIDTLKAVLLNSEGILEIPINSLSEYCEVVDSITRLWRDKVKERRDKIPSEVELFPEELSPWFRGVTNKNYKLEPPLLRNNIRYILEGLGDNEQKQIENIEKYLLQRFQTFSSPSLQRLPKEKIEWFLMMQHHKLPTRLLDWSKSSFIALFFAIRKYEEKLRKSKEVSDAAVWMLEPRRLSEACHDSRSIFGVNEDDIETINHYLGLSRKIRVGKNFPLPVIPNIVTPRISSQIGRFTLHTHEPDGLIKFAKKFKKEERYLVKFIISADHHRNLMRSLRVAGISHMNISQSQDMDGIADELMWRVRLGASDRSEMQNQVEESSDSN